MCEEQNKAIARNYNKLYTVSDGIKLWPRRKHECRPRAPVLQGNEGPAKSLPRLARAFLHDYCSHSTIHGLRYLSEDGRHTLERCMWAAMCVLAIAGATYVSALIWHRFITSPTVSVIESTSYPIANIPFPSVTLCDSNRVQWRKAMLFQQQHLAEASEDVLDTFHRFLESLAVLEFGDYDLVKKALKDHMSGVSALQDVNITQLMLEVMPSCEDMFPEECWWRNGERNCCSLFEVQRTEYGFCYSFNSQISEESYQKHSWFDTSNEYAAVTVSRGEGELRPRRTSAYGLWGGLRVTARVYEDQIPPGQNITPGIIMVIGGPNSYAFSGHAISGGQSAQVAMSAHATYTTHEVRSLKPVDRKCLFLDESDALGLGGYLYQNCMVQCHQDYSIRYCNCSAHIHPPRKNVRDCNITGLLCLADHNEVFNYLKPDDGNPYFDDNVEGMQCQCYADCGRLEYSPELFLSPILNMEDASQKVFLDIHFRSPALVRYRTDVVFGFLDLLVSFGGIAGLFLGCSMLSFAEIFYYLTLRFYYHVKRYNPSKVTGQKSRAPRSRNKVTIQGLKMAFISASESPREHPLGHTISYNV